MEALRMLGEATRELVGTQDEEEASRLQQQGFRQQVRADAQSGSPSKRSAPLESPNYNLSVGYVMRTSLLQTMSKAGRHTRRSDGWAHSPL